MSFEQLDNERYAEDKKKKHLEKEKRDQFWLEKQVYSETSHLLHNLAQKISKEFGIDISQVKELIRWDTLGDLEWLKSHVGKSETINFKQLQKVLQEAHSSIENLSKNRRETLRKSLEKNEFSPETHEYITSQKILPNTVIQRAKNPQNIGDQFIGLGVGIIDSGEAVLIFSYRVWKWVLLTPYHLYLLLTGKAKYEGFSKI